MAKLRKMLGSADSPYIVALMRLIETQSKVTIANWSVAYAKENWLPIFEKLNPSDKRLSHALQAAQDYLDGKIKLAEAKNVLKEAQVVAKEVEKNPVAYAAARAVSVAASTITTPTSALGMAFYGAAAVAYDAIGLVESAEVYDQLALEECMKMHRSLSEVAIEDEAYPAKINWNC